MFKESMPSAPQKPQESQPKRKTARGGLLGAALGGAMAAFAASEGAEAQARPQETQVGQQGENTRLFRQMYDIRREVGDRMSDTRNLERPVEGAGLLYGGLAVEIHERRNNTNTDRDGVYSGMPTERQLRALNGSTLALQVADGTLNHAFQEDAPGRPSEVSVIQADYHMLGIYNLPSSVELTPTGHHEREEAVAATADKAAVQAVMRLAQRGTAHPGESQSHHARSGYVDARLSVSQQIHQIVYRRVRISVEQLPDGTFQATAEGDAMRMRIPPAQPNH